jgi:hypothetical protein
MFKAATSLPVLGDFLALMSAVFYALYVVFLKVQIREESRIDMQLFFGFVGLFNIVLSWPMGVILHLAGMERFEIPSSHNAIVIILLNVSFHRLCLGLGSLYVLDAYHRIERLPICHCDAENYTSSGDNRSRSHHSGRGHR